MHITLIIIFTFKMSKSQQTCSNLSPPFAQHFLFPYTIPSNALFLIPFFRNLNLDFNFKTSIMSKRILLLPLVVLILNACEKTKDPGIEIPKPIDVAIISTYWNTLSVNYQYKAADGTLLYENTKTYPDPMVNSVHYRFSEDLRVTRTTDADKSTTMGTYAITRENKKDYLTITWRPDVISKYEITAYTNKTMSWHIVKTEGEDLKYTKDGVQYTAASREGYIELHCPCKD